MNTASGLLTSPLPACADRYAGMLDTSSDVLSRRRCAGTRACQECAAAWCGVWTCGGEVHEGDVCEGDVRHTATTAAFGSAGSAHHSSSAFISPLWYAFRMNEPAPREGGEHGGGAMCETGRWCGGEWESGLLD